MFADNKKKNQWKNETSYRKVRTHGVKNEKVVV